MLDRGEDTLPDIDGRDRSKEVNVAAAFMSSSLSANPSEPSVLCGVMRRLDEPAGLPVSRRFPFVSLRPLDLVTAADDAPAR